MEPQQNQADQGAKKESKAWRRKVCNSSLVFYKSQFEADVPRYAVVTPLRKAATYEQRKTHLGSSP